MKALFIFPTPVSVLPYGILYIADVFRRRGWTVKLLVNTFEKPLSDDDFLAQVRAFEPNVIGLSFATLEILNIYKLMGKLRQHSDALIICGGPHPSAIPEEVLINGADIVVKGEGEITSSEICDLFEKRYHTNGHLSIHNKQLVDRLKRIDGICYFDNGHKIHHTCKRRRNTNLNELPVPSFDLLDQEVFRAADGTLKGFNKIENGRGCPNQCTFCDRSVFGNKYVNKSAERIIDDIYLLKQKYGYNDFYFTDDTFTLSEAYVAEVCQNIIKSGLDITWACATRVNTVSSRMIQIMKKAGCRRIIFGVESGDNEWLRKTKKGFTVDTAIRALNLTDDAGIETHVNLMYGYPWETPRHIQSQIEFVEYVQRKVDVFQTYGALIPYPNTGIFEEYKNRFNLEGWWLKKRYQKCGQVIYQNALNPYEVSTFYQRDLHDDTYVYEDYFFEFSNEYKRKVRELGFLLGKHNLCAQYKSPIMQNLFYYTGVLSRFIYEFHPTLEKRIVSRIGLQNNLHSYRKIGEFIKK